MADTYAFNIRSFQTVWNQHVPNVVGMMEGAATFAIFNKGGSGKLMKIKQIDVFGNQPGSSTSGALANLSLISGYVVGSGRLISHIAMDSSYTPPTGVDIYANPVGVTVTAASIRTVWAAPLAMLANPNPHNQRQFPCSGNSFTRQVSGIGEAQPITLNQNEGIALDVPGNSTPMAYTVSVRYRYGGNTFCANAETSVIAGFPMWTMFNTNSTPVYIEEITMLESSLAVQNKFAVEFIEIMDETTGDEITVVPMDSNAPLPANILMRTGPRVVRSGSAHGATIALPLVRFPAWFHQAQNASIPFNQTIENAAKYSMFGQSGDSETILRPGTGIALYEEMGSNIGLPSFRGFFTLEDIPTGVTPVARSYVG
jgi:hypothetical protein